MQILVPDLSATENQDLARLRAEHNLELARYMAQSKEHSEQGTALLAAAEADLAKVEADNEPGPFVVVGYMPASKKTELLNHIGKRAGSEVDMDQIADSDREWVRWSIKGHGGFGDIPFLTEQVKFKGRDFDVVAWELVDLYEHMGFLYAMANAARKFNTLAEKKSKRSLPISGAETAISTASSAQATPTCAE